MPRPHLPYLQRQTARGKVIWYVRKGDGQRTRIRGEYGSDPFMAAYRAAVAGLDAPEPAKPSSASLTWLIERYSDSSAWRSLAPATRRQRENIFLHVKQSAGDKPYKAITRKAIVEGRERRRDTPSQARNFLDAMRGLFRWALDAEIVDSDPTAGVKNPPKRMGEGFAAWSETDVAKFQKKWPLGTRERVWLESILNTGLRRGDVVQLGRQHLRRVRVVRENGDVIELRAFVLKTEKSRYQTEVVIPLLPDLESAIDAGPCGDLAIICGERGNPLTKESFGNMFREACNGAGVKKSAHGLRKLIATRMANAGATVAELEAALGWHGGTMASHYTKTADRARLAVSAHAKLNGTGDEHPIPSHRKPRTLTSKKQ
ncbi:tyrosine-type recombinase/integrase [Pleomorphomonas oryzae]|uniref:tyrosine-type recombinase/integrase n=1 Tax=Pleomorphomonas oryzae TaxID=261934 RepID=UPI0009FC792A|nr:tyrosine-type recombinase/integrase [Pleomorphomonas oryzae]